ncbi:MAG: hypothetical protein ACXVCL_17360 [Bdellovibrio sp.]
MKILIAVIFCFVFKAIASGDRVGNGGDVIKCHDSAEILDFYESSEPLKDYASSDYKKILDEVLINFERLNPDQSKQYRQRLRTIEPDLLFKSGITLEDIKDSKHAYKPSGKKCKLLQIAIRKNTSSKVTKQFVIDEDLWKVLSDRSKAGLLLHEVIYEHLFKLGEKDSEKARILNSYLFSKKSFQDSRQDYWNLVNSLKLPIYKTF